MKKRYIEKVINIARKEQGKEVKMTDLHPNRKEAQEIRSRLRLRFNVIMNHHEVYTTVHGTGMLFQWHPCTDHVADWYKKNFNLTVDSFLQPSVNTGGLMEVMNCPNTPPPMQPES